MARERSGRLRHGLSRSHFGAASWAEEAEYFVKERTACCMEQYHMEGLFMGRDRACVLAVSFDCSVSPQLG